MTLSEKRTGQVACISIIILTVLFLVSVMVFPPEPYISAGNYIDTFSLWKAIPVIPSFLLIMANIPLFAALYFLAGSEKKIFAFAGIIAGGGYIVCNGLNYFLQLALFRITLDSGDYSMTGLFIMNNPASVASAMDNLGYLFLAVAFLFFSMLFNQRGLQSWIKSMFIIYGLAAILGTVGYLSGIRVLEFMVLLSALPYLGGIVLLYFEFTRIRPVG